MGPNSMPFFDMESDVGHDWLPFYVDPFARSLHSPHPQHDRRIGAFLVLDVGVFHARSLLLWKEVCSQVIL